MHLKECLSQGHSHGALIMFWPKMAKQNGSFHENQPWGASWTLSLLSINFCYRYRYAYCIPPAKGWFDLTCLAYVWEVWRICVGRLWKAVWNVFGIFRREIRGCDEIRSYSCWKGSGGKQTNCMLVHKNQHLSQPMKHQTFVGGSGCITIANIIIYAGQVLRQYEEAAFTPPLAVIRN